MLFGVSFVGSIFISSKPLSQEAKEIIQAAAIHIF
jgi:hypothetical protein